MDSHDSFTPKGITGTNLTCEQKNWERKISSPQELDILTKEDKDQKSSSPNELDKTSEVDIGQQVTENNF